MEKVIFSLKKYKESMGHESCPEWAHKIDGCLCENPIKLMDDYILYSCVDYVDDKFYIVSSDWVEVITID